jgi:four helix bundle protein
MDLSRFKLIELADQVSGDIWEEVATWNYFPKDTIGKQLVRAADSISANLSEAYGRYTYPERRLFSLYARGSLCETINWINKAKQRHLISEDAGNEIAKSLIDISYKLNGYVRSLKKPPAQSTS